MVGQDAVVQICVLLCLDRHHQCIANPVRARTDRVTAITRIVVDVETWLLQAGSHEIIGRMQDRFPLAQVAALLLLGSKLGSGEEGARFRFSAAELTRVRSERDAETGLGIACRVLDIDRAGEAEGSRDFDLAFEFAAGCMGSPSSCVRHGIAGRSAAVVRVIAPAAWDVAGQPPS